MANILDTLFLLFYAFRVTPDIHGSARNKNHFFSLDIHVTIHSPY